MPSDILAALLSPYRSAAAGEEMDMEFDPIYSLLQPTLAPIERDSRGDLAGQPAGGIWGKLQRGFLEAGREDLARMVNDPDFRTWVGGEGLSIPKGWSQNFPGHGRNYGVFQLWEGHDWIDVGDRPSLADQAYLAATKFNLTPSRIRTFADQIRSGTYEGWG